jgi:predicted metal-dependent peptidase
MIPDYNDYDMAVKNILFFIDTSASMSDKMVTEAYAEVKGAIDQYGGKLQGKLGFFDGSVKPPLPFGGVDDLMKIKPIGGGGTSFINVFKYVSEHMQEEPPVAIILITDGYAPFPEESAANGIPVLWVLNNTRAKPPWGKVLHIQEV